MGRKVSKPFLSPFFSCFFQGGRKEMEKDFLPKYILTLSIAILLTFSLFLVYFTIKFPLPGILLLGIWGTTTYFFYKYLKNFE